MQPPHVLKYSMPLLKPLASFWDMMTAPMGKPLPMGFPSVTISGTTDCSWKPQKWLPTRPKPHCTYGHKCDAACRAQGVCCCKACLQSPCSTGSSEYRQPGITMQQLNLSSRYIKCIGGTMSCDSSAGTGWQDRVGRTGLDRVAR